MTTDLLCPCLSPFPSPFHVRVLGVLENVRYPGLLFETTEEHGRVHLRVYNPEGVDTQTGEDLPWHGRWWRLSPHMTTSEIVGTAFKAILTCLEHEARESFLYKGQPVYDPHLDVDQLAAIRQSKECLDVRG